MIVRNIHLDQYDWNIKFLIDVDCRDLDAIEHKLINLKIPDNIIDDTLKHLQKCNLNKGLTYSNYASRQSVVIIGQASTSSQIFNTTVHELYHLIRHISTYYNTSEESEATLIGNIAAQLYPTITKTIRQS